MPPNLHFYNLNPTSESLYHAALHGLAQSQKTLAPKFFYDDAGSRLFDAICETPEYYPTRTEMALLDRHALEIAEALGKHCWLIEPGSGSSLKVRLLLEPLSPAAYQPLDICSAYLHRAASNLAEDFPWLPIYAVCVDFAGNAFSALPPLAKTQNTRAVFFPGSSIGNFEPDDARRFLRRLAAILGENGSLLIGVDLKKETHILESAYNDAAGVTAAFNLNLLHRINRELGANFDTKEFVHQAFYNEDEGRIEMYLVSKKHQRVRVNGAVFDFADGETIHTENSYKYSIHEFAGLAIETGFVPGPVWTDEREWFSLQCFKTAAL